MIGFFEVLFGLLLVGVVIAILIGILPVIVKKIWDKFDY